MRKELLSKKDIDRAVSRIAHEIIEKNRGLENICLVGIQSGGVHLAKRIASKIKEVEGIDLNIGSLDISFYRDDVGIRKQQPVVRSSDITCEVSGMRIILVDDVLFTGRSIRAAMDAIMDFGRPAVIQLVVLIDRGHRELPIRADYVGKNIPTALDENVEVCLAEDCAEEGVYITGSQTEGK
ncbi:MAG: bifunctional pyr operon transcriptional regulator/uracil phosphoribosyltransferase PyrR [Nitrospiraceae bacterium]|nr:bifunctional pyr operon transcriptional regulator/uracil phosphoribosyltransferase PyrR [Nitrospiraceae bacterium]